EPVRRTSWQFGQESIVRRVSWPLFRHTRSWAAIALDRLELRRTNPNESRSFSASVSNVNNSASFALAVVSEDNVDVCEIRGLTEGEARWMARVVHDRS